MRKLTSEETKSVEYDILCHIDKYCKDHNLRYFLWGGTLLGSVRHSGFIPWDDDIDIVMPRVDYEYFVQNYNSELYGVYSCESNNFYPFWYAKAYDKRTKKIEPIAASKKFDIGVDVDIFPLDSFGNIEAVEKTISKRKFYKRIWQMSIFINKPSLSHSKYIRKIIVHNICSALRFIGVLNSNKIARSINRIARSFSSESGEYMLYADSNISVPLYMDNFWFREAKQQLFENQLFNIPHKYDALLTKIYGDYMTPPPPEKRITHHTNNMYWRDKC